MGKTNIQSDYVIQPPFLLDDQHQVLNSSMGQTSTDPVLGY